MAPPIIDLTDEPDSTIQPSPCLRTRPLPPPPSRPNTRAQARLPQPPLRTRDKPSTAYKRRLAECLGAEGAIVHDVDIDAESLGINVTQPRTAGLAPPRRLPVDAPGSHARVAKDVDTWPPILRIAGSQENATEIRFFK
ncbi:hypothetical protein CC86DRAFT_374150 [Ophiobolus disseminans]|uniref:Uncharacterized protein n=1 Tax=Ophiobolus disseminans TaxID=1469910 RepID=A0A6A6ZIF1_9PLEO|nr:hypothetical protein CC86DRAFT_374150 [Ophiobolus disseminans]